MTSPVSAVFLDRDGVINRERDDYVKSWEEFEFLPGALQALVRLSQSGYILVVVTNQSVVGRGLTTPEMVEEIHRRMREEVSRRGGEIRAVFHCPHRPEDGCFCRKPRPGLVLKAQEALGLYLPSSYLIGDHLSDAEAALAVGCQPILVTTGHFSPQQPQSLPPGIPVFPSISEAADFIITNGRVSLEESIRPVR